MRRLTGLAAAAVVLAAVLWPVQASRLRAQVDVLLDAAPLDCTGAAVGIWPETAEHEDQPQIPVADITADMHCTLEIRVENHAGRDAAVERLTLPVLGPEASAGVRATGLDVGGREPSAGEVDAVFVISPPYDVPAGGSAVFSVFVVHRPGGCTPEGGTISFPGAPIVTVRTLGLSGERHPPGYGFGFRGTAVSSCDT